jgi:colanic acid/amylovoran biosynthesis glycosyltransferase
LKTLHLFTQKFPYFGGETFLEGELPFLVQAFDKVYIYPRESGDSYYAELPESVVVQNAVTPNPVQIRNLVKKHWRWMLKWILNEFVFAPHRFQSLRDFRFQWNRFVGLIQESVALNNVLHTNDTGVYYSYWFNEWATVLAMCREQGLKGKLVARMHGYDYDERQNSRGYFAFRRTELKAFNSVHQISQYGLNHVKKQYPWYDKFLLNRLGVNDNGLSQSGDDTDPYYLVSCSNFVPLKRISLIIETLSALKVPFEWTHFGSGEGMEAMQQLAASKLPAGSYRFMGYVPNAEILTYYREQKVDAFINMSELEGIPMSMMEAIASGIPVIGCNVCGVPEIVTEETGLLLPALSAPGQTGILVTEFLNTKSRNRNFRQGVKTYGKQFYQAETNYSAFVQNQLCAE